MKNKATVQEFHKGFNYMMELLQPSKVIFFYTVKDEHYMNEDIIDFVKVDRFKELKENGKRII